MGIFLPGSGGTSGGGGGGGGSAITSLSPDTSVRAFTAADENKVFDLDGDLFKIVRKLHAGHGKVVVPEILDHDLFRGFAPNQNDILNPINGEFWYIYNTGFNRPSRRFERYENEPGQATGFFPYNPFGIGAEWRTAPVEPGIEYVGDFHYRGSVPRQADMERNATAAGDVFVTYLDQVVLFVDEFTPETLGYAVFVAQPVVPHLGDAMVAFWGSGQVEELGAAIRRQLSGGDNYRWEFDQAEPNELIFGPDPGVRAVTAANAGDADLLTGETLADYEVLQFPPGRYLVDAFQSTRETADSDFRGVVYRVMSGDDDHLVQYGSGRSNATADPLGHAGGTGSQGMAIAFPVFTLTVADGETGQLTFISSGFSVVANDTGRDSAFRVFVTKVA